MKKFKNIYLILVLFLICVFVFPKTVLAEGNIKTCSGGEIKTVENKILCVIKKDFGGQPLVECEDGTNASKLSLSDGSYAYYCGATSTRLKYDSLCSNNGIKSAFKIVGYVIAIVKWIVPLIIIVFGMIDFGKAVISNDEKTINKATGALIRRFIAGIAIFFVPTIIMAILNVLQISKGIEKETDTNFGACTKCLFKPFTECDVSTTNENQNLQIVDGDSDTDVKDVVSYKNLSQNFYDNVAVVISGAEGKGSYCTTSSGEAGWKVLFDSVAKEPATAYGITAINGSLGKCSKIDSNIYSQYFSEGKFVEGACIPQKYLNEYAKNCIWGSAVEYINNWFNMFGGIDAPFNENQWLAILDAYNSGSGNVQVAVREYCKEYKVTKNHEQAEAVLLKVLFQRCFMNADCRFVARKDCELKLYFDGDKSCFINPFTTIYNPNYTFKYGKYLDSNYYKLTSSNTCECIKNDSSTSDVFPTCGLSSTCVNLYIANPNYFCSLHSSEYRQKNNC